MPGKILPRRYRVLSLVRADRYSALFTATYEPVDQMVLMRVFRYAGDADDYYIRRFQMEARKLTNLQNKHLLNYMDFGLVEPGLPYIIGELTTAPTLAEILRENNRLPVGRAQDLFTQVAKGLDYSHYAGVCHGGLSTENIHVQKDYDEDSGELVKLAGVCLVGLWSSLCPTTPNPHELAEFLGETAYMSPEQCLGLPFDGRSDIYSAGCLLYESLCGQPPFMDEDPRMVMEMHAATDPVPLPDVRHDLVFPKYMTDIVAQCMVKETTSRYQFAAMLKDDLLGGKSPLGEETELLKPISKAAAAIAESSAIPVKQLFVMGGVVGAILSALIVFSINAYLGSIQANEGAWADNIQKTRQSIAAGKYTEAKEAAAISTREAEKIKPPDHHLARSLANMGEAEFAAGRHLEAHQSFTRGLELCSTIPKPDAVTKVLCLSNLARLKLAEGETKEALKLAQDSLKTAQSTKIPERELVFATLVIAEVNLATNNISEANACLKKIQPHAKTLNLKDQTDLDQLDARVMAADGDLEEARNKLSSVLFKLQKELTMTNPLVADVVTNIARVNAMDKKYDVAISGMQNAMEIYKQTTGEKSPKIAEAATILAQIAEKSGDLRLAEDNYRLALETNEKAWEPMSPALKQNIKNLGQFLRRRGDSYAAEVYEKELKEITEGESNRNCR